MKYSNLDTLRKALVGKTIIDVEAHGGHGMVLTFTAIDREAKDFQKVDVCTYDDGQKHPIDEFYVALNDQEL